MTWSRRVCSRRSAGLTKAGCTRGRVARPGRGRAEQAATGRAPHAPAASQRSRPDGSIPDSLIASRASLRGRPSRDPSLPSSGTITTGVLPNFASCRETDPRKSARSLPLRREPITISRPDISSSTAPDDQEVRLVITGHPGQLGGRIPGPQALLHLDTTGPAATHLGDQRVTSLPGGVRQPSPRPHKRCCRPY